MKKILILLPIIVFCLISCNQANSEKTEIPIVEDKPAPVNFDPLTISALNNAKDSDFTLTTKTFTRYKTGSGIVGYWEWHTVGSYYLYDQLITYFPNQQSDTFFSDGTYKVNFTIKTRTGGSGSGMDIDSSDTTGTYVLSVTKEGNYKITTKDSKNTSSFIFYVSDKYLILTNQ